MKLVNSFPRGEVYIEAFGRPAVGKSYVTERLLKLPEVQHAGVLTELFPVTHGHRLSRVPRKLWLIFRYLPTLLIERKQIGSLVRRTPWVSAPAAGRALLNWIQLLAMVQRLHRQGRAILLCQGVFQAVWSLRFRSDPSPETVFPLQEWIRLSYQLLPQRPILVLHIIANPAAITERQRDRVGGQSVLDRRACGATSDQAFSARIADEILDVLSVLESEGHVRVVDFDNTDQPLSDHTLFHLVQELGLGCEPRRALAEKVRSTKSTPTK